MNFLASHLIIGGLALALADDAPELLRSRTDPSLALRADSIEVVYADGRFSHLEYGVKEQREPSSHRPSLLRHRQEKPRLRRFGQCISANGELQRTSPLPCGFVVDLSTGGLPLDLLAFDALTLKGKVTGRWIVSLADDRLAVLEDNRPLGELSHDGSLSFPLQPVAPHLDLKKTRQLVLILASRSGSIHIDNLEFARTESLVKPIPPRSIWMWDNRAAQADPETVVSELGGRQVRRVYLQIADSLDPLVPFLRRARAAGIEVFALDGSPDYPEHPEPLLARVQAVKEHNARYPDACFAGFQIDIEPHLKKDFRLRLDVYCTLFTKLLDRIREVPGAALPLSTVIPFWYDTVSFDGSNLAWHLIRKSDEAVIMSYRTDAAEIEAIAREELLYGERLGKPVLLGVETGRIPDELHAVFGRCRPDSPGSVAAAGSSWCRGADYAVPGGRISFAGKESAFRELLARPLPYRSFAGWVIHSYETAPRR